MKRNVILVDFEVTDKWEYKICVDKATKEKWKLISCITNKLHGSKLKVLLRYMKYFGFSFKIFLKRKQFDRVIAWQQFYGLILAFFCRLFRVKNAPEIYVMTFIYKPKKAKLYNKFIEFIVKSGYITKLIVLSDSEKNYYAKTFGVSESMFHCTRIGVSDVSGQIMKNVDGEKYYLAVGRSNRDYSFLREAWDKKYGKLIIINESYKEEPKDGIEVLRNCYGNDYLQMVANCYAQIIPLEDENISSGSLSFLQAMMLSRPTIVTENITVHDYINSKSNGIIIKKNQNELKAAIEYLNDPDIYKKICIQARKDYENNFSQYSLGIDIGKMIHSNSR